MNKDLAVITAVWRALFGARGGRFCCFIRVLIVLLSKSRRRCFAADFGSVSGDGRSFRCCTVGELLQDCDLASVRAITGVCDENQNYLERLALDEFLPRGESVGVKIRGYAGSIS